MDKTRTFNVLELREELILMMLNEIIEALEFKGYNPIKQIVGYLITGDIKYITSFNNSRKKIANYDRSEILLIVLNKYFGK